MIKVSTLRVDFESKGKQFQDVFVNNTGDKVEYVDITLSKRVDPVRHPDDLLISTGQDPKIFGMVATPSKIVLSPGQTKRVRLLNLNQNSPKELVYALRVEPIEPPVQSADHSVKTGGQVSVISAFVVGVYVLPPNPFVQISLHREDKKLIIRNTGNIDALLDKGQQCTEAKPPVCAELPPIRIYGDTVVEISLPQVLPVTYRVSYLNKMEAVASS